MSDKNTTIQEIREWVREFRDKRGWTRRQNAKNFAISLVLEAVELLEHYQWYEGEEIEADKVKKVIGRGKWITGAGFFSYLFQNIDNIVVGRLMGTAPLGLYQQAYKISTLPVTEVGQIFNKVTFPVYVAIGGDRERLKKAFFKTLLVILGLVLPFGLLIFFFSRPVILLLLGDKWLGAEPALKVLAIYGVLKSILNSSYSLFLSVKKQKIVMLAELTGILGIAIAVVPLVARYGLIGAGYSAAVGAIFCLPVILINLGKVFNNGSTDSK